MSTKGYIRRKNLDMTSDRKKVEPNEPPKSTSSYLQSHEDGENLGRFC